MKLFTRKPKLTGYVYDAREHQGWGNSIQWSDYNKRRIVGWLFRRPRIGDEVIFSMKSGDNSVAFRYIIKDVEYMSDPRDMFFATVSEIGLLGEKPIHKFKEQS